MADSCLLYYITDRKALAADEPTRRRRLLEKIAAATAAGIDYIQLREKDLTTRDLERLANEAIQKIAETKKLATAHWRLPTAFLINSRTDVALAVEAAGVHLRANDISPAEAKLCGAGTLARELSPRKIFVSISCHSPEEVTQAEQHGTDLALFAPIFEKKDIEKKDAPAAKAAGLTQLREACRNKIPVLALGGITLENAASCLDAGAAGIAAIRLFQENEIDAVVTKLRR